MKIFPKRSQEGFIPLPGSTLSKHFKDLFKIVAAMWGLIASTRKREILVQTKYFLLSWKYLQGYDGFHMGTLYNKFSSIKIRRGTLENLTAPILRMPQKLWIDRAKYVPF